MTRRQRVIAISTAAGGAALALAIGLIVALTGSSAPPAPPPAQAELHSPFTGEPVKALGPVLAVKIDNIVNARPQTGLQSADIMYVIPVEGGLTRFMAVYSSRIPPVIGPVRSAREDDLELLRQFGRPAFAWSGATPHLTPFIHRARIVDLYAGTAGGYFRDPRRVAPHNLYANPRTLLQEAPNASKATYAFRWSAAAKRWLVWMDGKPGMATEGGPAADGGTTYTIPSGQRMLFAPGQVWVILAAAPG
jgi:Protein of unknown function (DUF3048) N-terminal domain